MTSLFLDTEFTGLHQRTTLISLALVSQDGWEFYAEFTDFDKLQYQELVMKNFSPKLGIENITDLGYPDTITIVKGTSSEIVNALQEWLKQFDTIEIWADVLAYDWVLFCELFGGALYIPENIFYAPFDIATAFRLIHNTKSINSNLKDIKRFEFAGIDPKYQHHALWDARVEKICWEKLLSK